MANLKWVFDPGPPSGESQGGDLAKKAFSLNLNTFVREVLQNAKDANNNKHVKEKTAEVTFKLIELTGSNVSDFLEAIKWDKLSKHLLAGATGDYTFMEEEIEQVERENKLRLLLIEDNNTTGLYGDELHEDSPFKALIKDKLKSSKDDDSAGGSHGLGKTVLWGFSAFSTVFFYSEIHEELKDDKDRKRFIGRTAIPSHKFKKKHRGYSGSGWIGKETQRPDGEDTYAASLFAESAEEMSQNLFMEREGLNSGTSILVFGFREPIREESRSSDEILTDLKQSAAEWFWATMVKNEPGLIVNTQLIKNGEIIESESVDPNRYNELRPFIKAYKDFRNGNISDDFETGDETVLRNIKMNIPGRKDNKHDPFTGQVKLLVRLAEESTSKTKKVARFRGQGMIIDYFNAGDLALDAQNYHAVLATGTAAGNTTEDEYLDMFLRLSEPPEHTEWTSTEKLRNNYNTPYLKPLEDLKEEIKDKIRKLVTKESEPGAGVTPELQKRFRLGTNNGGFVGESDFSVDIGADIHNSRWEFNSVVETKFDIQKDWKIKIYPRMSEEDSSFMKGDLSLIKNIEAHAEGTQLNDIVYKDGYVLITVPKKIEKVYIKGITNPKNYPIDMDLSSFELRVEGEK
ncbi:hypothetical protein LQ318_07160 [Aliifodinibius salicampi]|uniref:Histidine kinase-, DNA gyrase B-, and HSP90-like ATPase n=1 Tax=Fodinibius salicampi TaxID=1920655 RepID=A0ABT3PXU6_9BACT|nr:hypothetical protein [Fodinibius salicampi]MCW9712679.1 hypothetical protein [Fodinibius salicampi]